MTAEGLLKHRFELGTNKELSCSSENGTTHWTRVMIGSPQDAHPLPKIKQCCDQLFVAFVVRHELVAHPFDVTAKPSLELLQGADSLK